jgi:hypothetical protein
MRAAARRQAVGGAALVAIGLNGSGAAAQPAGDGDGAPVPAASEAGRAFDDDDTLDDLHALDELDGKRWMLRGAFASQARVYLADRAAPGRDESWQQETRLELDVRWSDAISAGLRPWFLLDALDPELLRYEPFEAYLDLASPRWDLRLGQFIESWGIADTFNPLDVLNRTDPAVDPLVPPRRGELGARLRLHLPGGEVFGQPTAALYVLPLLRETDFPTADNRVRFAPPGSVFRPGDAVRPEPADALFVAARFDHTLITPWLHADVQAIGARGPSRFPTLAAMPQSDGSLHIVPEEFGTWTFGGGFRAVPNAPGRAWLSELTLKAEVVYTRPYALAEMTSPLPEDYVQLAAGLSRTVTLADADELSVIVEYLGEFGAVDALSELRLFDNDVAVRLAWSLNDPALTSFEVRAIVDVRDGTMLSDAVLRRQLRLVHEDLQLELSGQVTRLSERSRGALAVNPSNLTIRLTFAF